MKVCPTCQRCYEDYDTSCLDTSHPPLVIKRAGTRIIDGRYQLDLLLGRGGMGAVYKCTHLKLRRARAIKLLLPDSMNADPYGRQRLQREALTACSFDHPNVVRIHDFGSNPVTFEEDGELRHGDELYIVMEVLEGETLREYLRKTKPIPPRQAIEIALQIADGLAAVHAQGVIHRDLKPANIMLTRDHHGELLVKIVDFGSVKLINDSSEPNSVEFTGSLMVGSAPYTSPENCRGLTLDRRSDIYNLGLILYEMLAGRRPFESTDRLELINNHAYVAAPSLADICAGLPYPLVRLVMSALEKDPDARPQSAEEFIHALIAVKENDYSSGATAPPSPGGQHHRGDAEPNPTEETRVTDNASHAAPRGRRERRRGGEAVKLGRTSLAAILLCLFLLMSAFFIKALVEDVPRASEKGNMPPLAATPPVPSAPATNTKCSVGEECMTTTDANLRASPGKGQKLVGLAENGSRVRVLKVRSNWCEVIVLEHGRQKEKPESADQGWLDGSTLRPGG